MKELLKKKLIDLAFLALAALLGVGVYYGIVMIRGHMLIDQALIEVIKASQPKQVEPELDTLPVK